MKSKIGLLILLVLACVSAQVTRLGPPTSYPPLQPHEVQVFLTEEDVPGPFEKLALIKLAGDVDWTTETEMVEKAKAEAAKLGANGIILGETRDPSTGERIAADVFGVSAERKGQVIAIRFTSEPARPSE